MLEGKRTKPCELMRGGKDGVEGEGKQLTKEWGASLGGESGRESLLPLGLGERFRARARGESAERRP